MALLPYVIPEAAIWVEEQKIGAALIAGGYDPQDLPLTQVAAMAKLRDLHKDARRLGIPIQERHWGVTPEGNAEVAFRFEQETDAVMFKVMVL